MSYNNTTNMNYSTVNITNNSCNGNSFRTSYNDPTIATGKGKDPITTSLSAMEAHLNKTDSDNSNEWNDAINPKSDFTEETGDVMALRNEVLQLKQIIMFKDKEIKTLKKQLSKEMNDDRSMTMTVVDANRRMPILDLRGRDCLEDLILEADSARELTNCMKRDYLMEKAFLINNKLQTVQSSKRKAPHRSLFRDGVMMHNSESPLSCMCKVCFETKISRIGSAANKTTIDLSLISNSDLLLELDSSTYRAVFKEPDFNENEYVPSIEIEKLQFSKGKITLTPSTALSRNIVKSKVEDMCKARLTVLSMALDIEAPLRMLFYVRNCREWVNLVDTNGFEVYDALEDGIIDLENDCFLRFVNEAMGGMVDTAKMSSQRTITKMEDLTLMEETALQSVLINKKVHLKFDPYSNSNFSNHISMSKFEGSKSMHAYRLSDPMYRSINFFSSNDLDNKKDEVRRSFAFDNSCMYDQCDSEEDLVLVESDNTSDVMMPLTYTDCNMDAVDSKLESLKKNKNFVENLSTTEKIWEEMKKLDDFKKDYKVINNSYNSRMMSAMISSLKSLIMSENVFHTLNLDLVSDMYPSHVVKSAVSKNLMGRNIPNRMVAQIADDRLTNELFRLNRENYPYNYIKLLSFTYKEFLLIAFFWSDLQDFSTVVTMRDLNMFIRLRSDLPSYMKMLLRRGILLDTSDSVLDIKINKLYNNIYDSLFNDQKYSIVKTLYMIFCLRVHACIRSAEKVQETTSNLNQNSWKDLRVNNLINLNITGNRNSWYNMFHNRIKDHNMKFINGATISIMDRITVDEEDRFMVHNMMNYTFIDEPKLYKGMSLLFSVLSLWGITLREN